MNTTASKKLTQCRAALTFKQKFFGHLLIQYPFVEINGSSHPALQECKTMATDGEKIYYDPEFVLKQSKEALQTVLLHEILHIILDHPARAVGMIHDVANMAMDYMVNGYLDYNLRPLTWPVCGKCLDHRYDDMPFEAIYQKLLKNGGNKGGGGGSEGENQSMGEVIDPRKLGKSPEQIQKNQDRSTRRLIQAAQVAQRQGKLPAGMGRIISGLLTPELPWTEILKQFVQQIRVKTKYNWTRPHRGMFAASHGEVFMPSLDGRGMGEIVVFRDTSGSVDQDLLDRFEAEIRSIHEDCKPSKLHIIDVDANVQSHHHTYGPSDAYETHPLKGGGGTDFQPAFRYLEEQEISPACVIYFTDMYGNFPDVSPDYPVLWVSYSSIQTAPFGEVINV